MSRARLRAGGVVSYTPTEADLAGLTFGDPADRWAGTIAAVQRNGTAVLAVLRPDGVRLTKSAVQGSAPGQFSFGPPPKSSHPDVPPSQGASEASGALHLYLAADSATADDRGGGTSKAAPLKTLDEAYRRVNALVRTPTPVVLHIASAPVNGAEAYKWTEPLGPIGLSAPLVIIGDGAGQAGDDGFTELLVDTVDSGATNIVVPVTGGGMGVDAFLGKTLELTSGASVGWRRTINGNSATDLRLCNALNLGAPVQNDTLRILEPAVEVQLPSLVGGANTNVDDAARIIGTGRTVGNPVRNSSGYVQSTSMIYFVNIRFSSLTAAPLYIEGASVCSVGCEVDNVFISMDRASLLVSGMDFISSAKRLCMPQQLGLTPGDDTRVWAGWSTFWDDVGVAGFTAITNLVGFLHSNDEIRTEGGLWQLVGGRVSVTNGNFWCIDASRDARVQIEPNSSLSPMELDNDTDDLGAACISCRQMSIVAIGGTGLTVTKTNRGHGVLAWADGSGQGSLPGYVSLTSGNLFTGVVDAGAPENAFRATGGSRINFRNAPTLGGTWATECAVAATPSAAPAAGASGTLAALAADGDAYPTVASGLTGVNGWIQRH